MVKQKKKKKKKISTILPIYWLIGSKSSGICQNFIICTLVLHLMYGPTQKFILFPHWFGSLAVNAGATIKILIISHQLSAVWFILSNQVYKIKIPIYGLPFGRYPIGSIGI